jgi:hypothetical protein
MQHAMEAACQSLGRPLGQSRYRDSAVNHDGLDRKALGAQIARKVARAVGASEVEQRRSWWHASGDESRQIADAAVRGGHVGEPCGAHSLRAPLADREDGYAAQRRALPGRSCLRRIGAGDQDRRAFADLGPGNRLDLQQRSNNHGVAALAQEPCGPLRVGFRAREKKPHGLPREEIGAGPAP